MTDRLFFCPARLEMLIDIDSGKVIHTVPFARDFETLRSRLSRLEFDGMVARINELIDEPGAHVAVNRLGV